MPLEPSSLPAYAPPVWRDASFIKTSGTSGYRPAVSLFPTSAFCPNAINPPLNDQKASLSGIRFNSFNSFLPYGSGETIEPKFDP